MTDDTKAPRSRCWTCWRPSCDCLCPLIRPVPTRTHFVLLMHPREARKRLGTGRLAHACLPNSDLVVGVDFSDHAGVGRWVADESHRRFLLYPGGPVLGRRDPVADAGGTAVAAEGAVSPAPMRIFILDGSWPTAKVMLRRSRNVQALPRLSIEPEEPSRFRIKQQPDPLCLSTIESVHRFLVEADRAGEERTTPGHDVLVRVLEELCRRQIEYASDPARPGYRRKPYSQVEDRSPVKRWSTRNFFVK